MSFPLDLRQPPQRLLVRSANWLGDAVMSTPALLRLRERFPDRHIAILTPEKLADLWLEHPAVDGVLAFGRADTLWRVARRLRRERFDLGLVLPNSPRSALELWLAGIPRRVGYGTSWRRWFLTDPVLHRAGFTPMRKRSVREIRRLTAREDPPAPPQRVLSTSAHQMHDFLHLAAALGASPDPRPPQVFLSNDEVQTARRRFGLETLDPWWLGLNAGAEYGPAKRWPADRFAAAAVRIQRQTGCGCIVFGGSSDVPTATALADAIASETAAAAGSHAAVLNVAGRTTLRELCALLHCCRVVLTNDTGPMHLAAAVGTPVVVPFGSTSPELTAPGLPGDARHRLLRANVPCAPCFLRACPLDLRCLRSIGVEQVVAAAIAAAQSRAAAP